MINCGGLGWHDMKQNKLLHFFLKCGNLLMQDNHVCYNFLVPFTIFSIQIKKKKLSQMKVFFN